MGLSIAYVGELYRGAVSEQRKCILEKLGHTVFPIEDHRQWSNRDPRRLLYRVSTLAGYPLDLLGLNKRIIRTCRTHSPDILWVDKGIRVHPKTLATIQRILPRVILVNLNPDDPFCKRARGWGWYKQCLPFYDHCFVPRDISIKEYLAAGARRAHRFYWGFTPEVHGPVAMDAEERQYLGGPVGFIGSYERPRFEMLLGLANAGVYVRIWGDGWSRFTNVAPYLRIEGCGIWDKDFARGICSFDINLCFLNKQNRDTLNTRCVAIPACGGFMLAERTEDLKALFAEGKEADFFSTTQELIDKTRFYLKHDDLRRRIAAAGRERCVNGRYSNEHRLQGMIDLLKVNTTTRHCPRHRAY